MRKIQLYLSVDPLNWYLGSGSPFGATVLSISAGELVGFDVQLTDGSPCFDNLGNLSNPYLGFAGTLAAAESVIDNNYNWYDRAALAVALAAGTEVSAISARLDAVPRVCGTLRLDDSNVVNYNGFTVADGIYSFATADADFAAAGFTPGADFAADHGFDLLEQPVIVSGDADDSDRETGRFFHTLDALNPVYESMVEGNGSISGTTLEFTVREGGRPVLQATLPFDCLGSLSYRPGVAALPPNSWSAADSRYVRRSDWDEADTVEFSVDGLTAWHAVQTGDDEFVRYTRPGATAPGAAVKLVAGEAGAVLLNVLKVDFDDLTPPCEVIIDPDDCDLTGTVLPEFELIAPDGSNLSGAVGRGWGADGLYHINLPATLPPGDYTAKSSGGEKGTTGLTGAAGAVRPILYPTFWNDSYGSVGWLDADRATISTTGAVFGVTKVRLRMLSADATITGDIAITVAGQSFTVAVGATLSTVTLTLSSAFTGLLSIVRDTTSASDTLKDGDTAITVIVADCEVLYE
ncbi:MAG: hypothetical protein PHI35_08690 [Victivallaceae bacterium]|nr:hypothetical protein [Victivallaceae bacterium]